MNPSCPSAGWDDNNGTRFIELLQGLVDLAQRQTYLLVIPDIEEHVVESEFSVAESVLAEMERSINRFAEGIPLLEERRFSH